MFRSHLPTSLSVGLIPNIITHLSSESIVVQTYAALCLEKFLSLKDRNPSNGTMTARITSVHLQPSLQTLLSGLFTALSNPNHPENDYIMKCILRVLVVVGSDIAPISVHVLPPLIAALDRVSKNPTNPHFNHYLFECLAIIVKSVTSSITDIEAICIACNQFESLLFPIFQIILSQDVVEFVPYAFQIFAQLLNARPDGEGLSESYRALFPPLLSPALWERKGNVPALTDLFRAYMCKGINDIIAANHLEGVLGVFQKLLSLKSTESYAFKLLNAIINCTPLSTLNPYLPTIFGLLLTRLQEHMKDTKTPKYCKSFVHTICFFAAIHGGQNLENTFLSIDPSGGLINTLITEVWSHNSAACVSSDKVDIKHIIIGGTKILCQSNVKQNSIAWGSLIKSIVTLLDVDFNKVGLDLDDNNSWGLDDEAADREFDSAYSKLAYAQISDPDGTLHINSASGYFTSSLGELCKQHPGNFIGIIQQSLEHHQLQLLQGLCQQNGVVIM
jgi:exportin-2 (importin alpha re-exporter)